MAEANTVDPVEARTFAAQFLPDPKQAGTMPEADVLTYHGRVKGAVDTAVKDAIKARGEFGPDWRKVIAGDDPDAMKTLERFPSPKELYGSYNSLRTKVSSGELKAISPYPAAGTPEQQAAWRAEAGIPTKPEEYKVEPPQGVVIGEADKPFVEGWLKHAHTKNLSNEAVNAGIAWWGEERIRRQEAAAQVQTDLKRETEDKLRAEWGQEFRPTMTRIEGLLDANLPAGSDMKEAIMGSVATAPDFARLMAALAFQLNPGSTLVPGGAEGQVKSVTDWLSKADALMRSDRPAYNKSEYSKDYTKYANAYKAQTGKDWGKG